MREVGVIMDGDPRKARAFEIEKYATYAGLSKDFIQQGINAVNNDDWDAQLKTYKDITKTLAKNPNWNVDMPTQSEWNVMLAEEKAIQAASLASLNIEEINREWNEKINEQVKDVQPLASLNLLTLRSIWLYRKICNNMECTRLILVYNRILLIVIYYFYTR